MKRAERTELVECETTANTATIRAAASEVVLTFATVKRIYEAMKGLRDE